MNFEPSFDFEQSLNNAFAKLSPESHSKYLTESKLEKVHKEDSLVTSLGPKKYLGPEPTSWTKHKLSPACINNFISENNLDLDYKSGDQERTVNSIVDSTTQILDTNFLIDQNARSIDIEKASYRDKKFFSPENAFPQEGFFIWHFDSQRHICLHGYFAPQKISFTGKLDSNGQFSIKYELQNR